MDDSASIIVLEITSGEEVCRMTRVAAEEGYLARGDAVYRLERSPATGALRRRVAPMTVRHLKAEIAELADIWEFEQCLVYCDQLLPGYFELDHLLPDDDGNLTLQIIYRSEEAVKWLWALSLGRGVQQVPAELLARRDFALEAVNVCGLRSFLDRLPKELRSDTEVMLSAIQNNMWALEVVTEELFCDRDFLRQAVGINRSVLTGCADYPVYLRDAVRLAVRELWAVAPWRSASVLEPEGCKLGKSYSDDDDDDDDCASWDSSGTWMLEDWEAPGACS